MEDPPRETTRACQPDKWEKYSHSVASQDWGCPAKKHIACKLLQRFAADAGALAKLKVGDAVALAEAIRAMDKAAQAADVVVRWIAACDAWKHAGSYDQQVLAAVLKAGETEDSREKAVQWALKVYNDQLAALSRRKSPRPSPRPDSPT